MTYPWAERIGEAFDATSYSVLITDATLPDHPIIYVNAAFTAMCGYDSAEVIGRNCRFMQGPGSDASVRAEIAAAIAAGRGIRREILNYRKDGTAFRNDLSIDPIRDPAGALTGFVGIQYNSDAMHHASRERAEAESKLAAIADLLPGYIYQRVMRPDGSIEVLYCSPSICRLLEIDYSQVAHRFYDHVHPDDREVVLASIRNSAAEMSMFREEFRLVSSSGIVHWLRSDAPPRRMPNGDIVWDGLAIEIGAEKRWQSEIADQALRDPLTSLLTRAAWRQALAIQLNPENRKAVQCGVLCIDIKEFSEVNDRLGQHAGDQILRETAQRLAGIAEQAGGVAARLGGDEFAILLPSCSGEPALSALARTARQMLGAPIALDARQVTIQAYIGGTLYQAQPDGDAQASPAGDGPARAEPARAEPAGDLASELITQAELALRWAKRQSGHSPVLYSRARDDRFQNRALLGRSLERAIVQQELELHYQPLIDLASGRIVSVEALVRWNHPTLGLQRPDLFIPMAEASGLIVPLGSWVLGEAMRQHRLWQQAGLAPPRMAVNVSGVQLLDSGFIETVEQALRDAGAEARDFEIELTEGVLIEPLPEILASLMRLREMGFRIAIDDFGSGHATFRYLRDFPIDKLKIDQLFIRKLVLESNDALIIRAVISLTRSLGIDFVAEGVETQMQRDFLEREGCETGQGFYFSLPLVAEDFAWLLANDVRLPRRLNIR